jgi:hypothetical protein
MCSFFSNQIVGQSSNIGVWIMARTEVFIKEWADVIDLFNGMDSGRPFGIGRLYRGQSNAEWALRDSLSRLIPLGTKPEDCLAIEQQATRYFSANARLHLDPAMVPALDVLIEWWSLMQHFGAPTRLLDWSQSPYVALYFAVAENWNEPGAVWTVDVLEKIADEFDELRPHLEVEANQQPFFWTKLHERDFCFFIDPARHHIRSASQLGRFSFCGRIPSDHGLILEKTLGGMRDVTKVIIPPELKPLFQTQLRKMNVAPHSLFPGLDGLGGTVRDSIRLELHRS